MIERRDLIEVIAIGIGHDVTRYYKNAITITDIEQLAGAMTEQLARLFDKILQHSVLLRWNQLVDCGGCVLRYDAANRVPLGNEKLRWVCKKGAFEKPTRLIDEIDSFRATRCW